MSAAVAAAAVAAAAAAAVTKPSHSAFCLTIALSKLNWSLWTLPVALTLSPHIQIDFACFNTVNKSVLVHIGKAGTEAAN